MRRLLRAWADVLVPLAVLLAAVAWRGLDPAQVIQGARLSVFDTYQRLQPRTYEPAPVRIVDIDDATLARIGQWPWPRTVLAELVATLTNAGAAVVAFDIVFAEPDRTSPSQALAVWPETEELRPMRAAIAQLPDHDEVLAEVMKQAPVVAGFAMVDGAPTRAPTIRGRFARLGPDPAPYIPRFPAAVTNLPVLEQAAKGNGSFNAINDRDGLVRRVPMALCYRSGTGCILYPSLVAEALRVPQGASTLQIKSAGASGEDSFGADGGVVSVRIGDFVVPTDRQGEMLVHFTRPEPTRYIPAWRVLAGNLPDGALEGMVVFIGTSAAGLKDQRATPLDPAMPGVEIHAQATEQVLTQHFLERPDWSEGAETAFTAVLGLLLVVLLRLAGAIWAAALALVAVGGAVSASWYAYSAHLWLTEPVTPAAMVLAVYISGSLFKYWRTEGERREVRGAFARYLSPALVEQLAREPDRLKLGGELRYMTFLFSDIRGFTALSERYKSDPAALTSLINAFLTAMSEEILKRQGTIDKYMGDCIMAFWNAPLDDGDHEAHACEAALAMDSILLSLNDKLRAEGQLGADDKLDVGIGLNSGEVIVGNMGSQQRFDYSVLGDAVNLASRLEGQSKSYGVKTVIGETTHASVSGRFATLELDLLAVKGKSEAVHIYTVLGQADLRATPAFQNLAKTHAAMLAAYRYRDWDRAEHLIARCRAVVPDEGAPGWPSLDALYRLYETRVAVYRVAPPDEDWNGIHHADTK